MTPCGPGPGSSPPPSPPGGAGRCTGTYRRGVGRAAAGSQPGRLPPQLGQLRLAAPAPAPGRRPLQRPRLGARGGSRSLGRRAAGAALLLGGGRRPLPRGELPHPAPLRHLRRQHSSATREDAEATLLPPSSRGKKKSEEKKKEKTKEKLNRGEEMSVVGTYPRRPGIRSQSLPAGGRDHGSGGCSPAPLR